MSDDLIRPHGGRLVNLLVGTERAQELAERATHWQSWELSTRQLCDLELLLSGAFSPLQGFLGRSDYESVCASMRLADGPLWPIPVMLDVPESIVGHLGDGRLPCATRRVPYWQFCTSRRSGDLTARPRLA